MTDIIKMTGTYEQKVAKAKLLKAEFEQHCPEMVALRQQLIAAGMCANNLSSVSRVITLNIDYDVTRDDPDRYMRKSRIPPILTEEIARAIQDRTSRPVVPANIVLNSRGSRRRR